MKKFLLVDNFDSFTYNLVELARCCGVQVDVYRNNCVPLDTLETYTHVMFSPGPGLPKEAGLMPKTLELLPQKTALLGVCLGHQCIGEYFGGTLKNLEKPFHGKSSKITLKKSKLFNNLEASIEVARYHSWVVDAESMPSDLICTAVDAAGDCMSLEHRTRPIYGVQFHPESVMTPFGKTILENFIAL